MTFIDKRPVQATIELDACLNGIGAHYDNAVYAYKFTGLPQTYSIVHLEMINIPVALRVWGSCWANKKIIIKCDNQAVVSVLNTGKSRDPQLCTIARNIFMYIALNDINLIVLHVLGSNNTVADLLSRWTGSEQDVSTLYQHVDNPVCLTFTANTYT